MITTVTGKNQVTLPAEIVRSLKLAPGVKLSWFIGADHTLRAHRIASRQEQAHELMGRGRKFLRSGRNPITALVAERGADG
ncbi:MAG: AbrB/MazE/SpoVT family DNA-binding domain-containing protein [Chthoniobacterales bacterium]|nr:AbrB/MazE/SpoVT family DNA-binding domain-containing protein [Chthoniobacterales bacterium]